MRLLQQESVLTQVTTLQRKKTSVLHCQIQSTLQYPVLANPDGELTVLWMQSQLDPR